MKILQLILHKYKRTPLISQPTLTIDFVNKLNLFIGTNGSGKSSIVGELSPLPSSKESFYTGGYKKIMIEHNKSTYVLSSSFLDKPDYSFIVDGEELNPSGTISIQRELVSNHFRLTQDIQDILTGWTSFTGMQAITRKKVFNLISNINIEYVLDKYESLKEELKKENVLYKTQQGLLQTELVKVLDVIQKEMIEKDVCHIESSIDHLLVFRAALQKNKPSLSIETISGYIYELDSKLKKQLQSNFRYLASYPFKDLDKLEAQYKSSLLVIKYKLDIRYKQLETSQEVARTLNCKLIHNQEELNAIINNNNKQVEQIKNSLTIFKDWDSYERYKTVEGINDSINLLTSVQYRLMETLSEMPINEEYVYAIDKEQAANIKKQNLSIKREKAIAITLNLKKEIEHVQDHLNNKLTQCPNCKYKWSIEYTQEYLDSLIYKEQYTSSFVVEAGDSIAELDKYIDECACYFRKFKLIQNTKRETYEQLVPMWNHINYGNLILVDPASIKMVITNSLSELTAIGQIHKLTDDITKTNELLELANKTTTVSAQENQDDIKILEEEIFSLQTEKATYTLQLNELEYTRNLYYILSGSIDIFKQHVEQLNAATEYSIAQALIKLTDDEIRTHKLALIETKAKLENSDKVQYFINKYKEEVAQTQDKIYTIETILKELSPKDGLIAKTIGIFINKLLTNMNIIIASIWSYQFSIVPYDLDNDDKLDYKFKVMVNDKVISPDITKTSGGMREIIDLAFRLTIMKFLGLNDYPIYLDEFGIKLDSHHKSKIYELIFTFINSTNYSQVFLISHLDLSYGNIKDTDIIALDTENISYSGTRNILQLS